jgi:hypothetical protein
MHVTVKLSLPVVSVIRLNQHLHLRMPCPHQVSYDEVRCAGDKRRGDVDIRCIIYDTSSAPKDTTKRRQDIPGEYIVNSPNLVRPCSSVSSILAVSSATSTTSAPLACAARTLCENEQCPRTTSATRLMFRDAVGLAVSA